MSQQPLLIQNLVSGTRYSIVDRQGVLPTTIGTLIQVIQSPGSQVRSAQFNNLSTETNLSTGTNPARVGAFQDNEFFFFDIVTPPGPIGAGTSGGRRKKRSASRKYKIYKKFTKSKRKSTHKK